MIKRKKIKSAKLNLKQAKKIVEAQRNIKLMANKSVCVFSQMWFLSMQSPRVDGGMRETKQIKASNLRENTPKPRGQNPATGTPCSAVLPPFALQSLDEGFCNKNLIIYPPEGWSLIWLKSINTLQAWKQLHLCFQPYILITKNH